MPDPVPFLVALAMSAYYPTPLPVTREEADRLLQAADEIRRLRGELERSKAKP